MATLAGLYAEVATDKQGRPLAGVTVTVKNLDGSTASLFTDKTKATAAANPVTVDALGMLRFYAAPGEYDLVVAGVASRAAVQPHPDEPAGTGGGGSYDALGAATAAQAYAVQRANHTGSQTSGTISDFTEAVQDTVAALLGSGTNVTLTYDDTAGTLQIATTAADAETVRDLIGVALVGVGNISIAVNDAADTITVSTTATVNSTDAALRARASHTGTQSADTLTDGATNAAYLLTERAKLAAIAAGATANATDAQLRDRTTHTGVQAISTVTGLQTALDTIPTTEAIQDTVAGLVLAGSNVTVTYNDAANTLTISATSGSAAPVDIQVFSTSGTWTKPTGGQTQCRIEMYAGGGGGSSGSVGLADLTDIGVGGSAGGGGAYSEDTVPLSYLGATEPVVVGTGGAGGAARNGTLNQSGLVGVIGVASSFGSGPLVRAGGGINGGAPTNAAIGSQGTGGATGVAPGSAGGQSGLTSTAASGTTSQNAGAGGGGGGGTNQITTGTIRQGGAGATCNITSLAGGTAGAAGAGSAGGVGNDARTTGTAGSGGGGGTAGSTTTAGGTGAAGGFPGGGGGGGGGSRVGAASGAGGAGGAGIVVVTSW